MAPPSEPTTGAPVLAHAAELAVLRGEREMSLCPTGFWGRLFVRTPLPHQPYSPVAVDLPVRDRVDLSAYGVDREVIPTPGHSAGSLSVVLANGDALVGDLVSSGVGIGGVLRLGRAIRPPFDEDPESVERSLDLLLEREARRFLPGHGGPIQADEIRRHRAELAQRGLARLPAPRSAG